MQRVCPNCNNLISYKNKISYKKALKLNKNCIKCTRKEVANRPEIIEKMKYYGKLYNTGINNPMFGKKHTDEAKLKISNNTNNNGKNNPMYGKNVYSIWVEKYGQDIADKKLKELKEKQSFNSSGENNPMYGKPSPNGSGNGWKGWYNGIFFRSLLELSFLVNYIERFNMNMVNGECKKYIIQYEFNGKICNYFSDYIINDKYMIEVKPKKLHNTPRIKAKKIAAINFCNENNLIYKLIDPIKINKEQILKLIDNNSLIFMDKYLEKVINY